MLTLSLDMFTNVICESLYNVGSKYSHSGKKIKKGLKNVVTLLYLSTLIPAAIRNSKFVQE